MPVVLKTLIEECSKHFSFKQMFIRFSNCNTFRDGTYGRIITFVPLEICFSNSDSRCYPASKNPIQNEVFTTIRFSKICEILNTKIPYIRYYEKSNRPLKLKSDAAYQTVIKVNCTPTSYNEITYYKHVSYISTDAVPLYQKLDELLQGIVKTRKEEFKKILLERSSEAITPAKPDAQPSGWTEEEDLDQVSESDL